MFLGPHLHLEWGVGSGGSRTDTTEGRPLGASRWVTAGAELAEAGRAGLTVARVEAGSLATGQGGGRGPDGEQAPGGVGGSWLRPVGGGAGGTAISVSTGGQGAGGTVGAQRKSLRSPLVEDVHRPRCHRFAWTCRGARFAQARGDAVQPHQVIRKQAESPPLGTVSPSGLVLHGVGNVTVTGSKRHPRIKGKATPRA